MASDTALSKTVDDLVTQAKPTAANYLRKGAQHIEDRASQRDCENGERSMAKTVEAFNTIYGHTLTETEGWQFMSILKKVRAVQGNYHEDDYEDDIAYSALAAECEAHNQQ